MKQLIGTLLLLLVASSSRAQVIAKVYDGRVSAPIESLDRWERNPAVGEARVAAQRYWYAENPDAQDRAFRVLAVARGSFTRPQADQHAVLYTVGSAARCCPFNALAIVEGDNLILNRAGGPTGYSLHTLPDINVNGRNELVFFSSGTGMGSTEGNIVVEEVGTEASTVFGRLQVYSDNCSSGFADKGPTALSVFAIPGAAPRFLAEQHSQPRCEDPNTDTWGGAWESEGNRASIDMEDLYNDPPVALPVR